MDAWKSTANCSYDGISECSYHIANCSSDLRRTFNRSIRLQLYWRVDALLLVNAVLAVVIVGMGAYGQRYRHHPFTRLIFLGATTLFLPIISSVTSTLNVDPSYVMTLNKDYQLVEDLQAMLAICEASTHATWVVQWAFLVHRPGSGPRQEGRPPRAHG